MGIGFLHAMTPAFRKLYKDNKDLRIEAMQRHTSFFNCEPCLGSSIVGLVLAMEEQKALGAELDNDAITSIKTGLMGPLSGIGDTLIQGVILPLLIAFAVDFAKGGNWVIPLVFSLVMAIIVFGISPVSYTHLCLYTLSRNFSYKPQSLISRIAEYSLVDVLYVGFCMQSQDTVAEKLLEISTNMKKFKNYND